MDDATRHAWILLAIPGKGTTLHDIAWRTAAINHGPATESEIREGLDWLSTHGLISAADGVWEPTETARQVFTEEWSEASMYETWKRIASRLKRLRKNP
jgi:hypothetical protein